MSRVITHIQTSARELKYIYMIFDCFIVTLLRTRHHCIGIKFTDTIILQTSCSDVACNPFGFCFVFLFNNFFLEHCVLCAWCGKMDVGFDLVTICEW